MACFSKIYFTLIMIQKNIYILVAFLKAEKSFNFNFKNSKSKVIYIYKTHFWNHALKKGFLFSRSEFVEKHASTK